MKFLKFLIICFLCLIFTNTMDAQNINKRAFFDTDFYYEFEINHSTKKIKLKKNKKYYWYKLNKIYTNFYGSSGEILHSSFQKKKVKTLELLEKGVFHYGLKNGLWKEWHVNGNLSKIVNWKNGVLHGQLTTYNKKGEKLTEGRYKKGKKSGTWIDFQKKDTVLYRKGTVKEIKLNLKKKKSLKEFFTSLFSKKNKSTKSKSSKNKKSNPKKKRNTKQKTTPKKNNTKTKK